METIQTLQRRLLTVYLGSIVWLLAIIAVAETNAEMTGAMTGQVQSEFLLLTLMELATLACAFMALRLFKFKKVHADLCERKVSALKRWALLRLALLFVPLLANTILYYAYMNTTFGYLGLMLVLCLPFVYPSLSRCQSEIES